MINFQAGSGQVWKFILINSFVLINAKEQSVEIQASVSGSHFEGNHQVFLCSGSSQWDCLLLRIVRPSKTPHLLLSSLVLISFIKTIKSPTYLEPGHCSG